MASSRLLELPFEIRTKILEYLFRNPSAEVWADHVDLLLKRNIFYVCKQLSLEARSIAKERITLRIRTGASLEKIPKATRRCYFPELRRLQLSSPKPTPGLDLKLFPSLRRVETSNELFSYGPIRYTSFRLPFGPVEGTVHAILAGVLDEKLKACDREEYDHQSNWFTNALRDPERSFQMVATALLAHHVGQSGSRDSW